MKSACGRRTARPEAVGLASQADVKLALKELFESPTCPDSLFSANNASTIWVIEALREMKIEMGIDVALVDSTTSTSILYYPPVTAIRQPAAELGRVSARLLLQRINGEFTASSVRTVLPVTLVVRESCGCKGKNRSIPLPPLN